MLRALLLYFSQASWVRRIVTSWSLTWRVASRFVAGETLEDAVRVVKELNKKGLFVTLDHLGEHTYSREVSRIATEDIIAAIHTIEREGLNSSISIKLTQIGLSLDEVLCAENLAYILGYAQECDIFVRIDMEDSPYLEQTLILYRWMREQGFDNVGVVIQSYFYRSEKDTRMLMQEAARVRMVKGAYREPPDLAYPNKKDVDSNFDRLTDILIEGALQNGALHSRPDGRIPPIPAIASQDEARINYAKLAAVREGLSKEAIEFQMLYGIRRDLQESLRDEGYPVRVYVPYGSEWYPYFMRRLAERPANLWFFLSNLMRG